MKTIYAFKPDFKYSKILKKEWLSITEVDPDLKDSEFYLLSFRFVENYKPVNKTKEILMNHFKISREEIVSETILEESDFIITDGQFILSKIKRKVEETDEKEEKVTIVKDVNFFFLRDIANLVNKHYFGGTLYEKSPE